MASSARIDELQKKLNENPRRYFAMLADEYRKAGDPVAAIELCRTYLAQQPGHMSGHIVLGKALYETGDLAGARETFETALGLDPENLIALRYLGDVARQQGDPYGARGWYQRVLDADPRNDEVAALIRQIDETPVADAIAGASRPTAPVDPELTAELAAAPDTLGEDTTPDGTLPPALEPAAIAYLAEETTLEVPRFDAGQGGDTLELDASAFDTGIPTTAPDAAEERFEEGLDAFTPPEQPAAPPMRPTISSDIGLETMEFVAPSRDEPGAVDPGLERPDYDFDPHVVDGSVKAEETPAAFVTETMAELYLQQGFTDEALAVYRQLSEANPADENLRARIQQLETGGRSSLAFEVSEDVVRAAQERRSRATRRTARHFFASLAARRAPGRADGYAAAPEALPADPYAYGGTGVDTSSIDAAVLEAEVPAYDAPLDQGPVTDEHVVQVLETSAWEQETAYATPVHEVPAHAWDAPDAADPQAAAPTEEQAYYEQATWDARQQAAPEPAGEPAADPYAGASGQWEGQEYGTPPRGTNEYDVSDFETTNWDEPRGPAAPTPLGVTPTRPATPAAGPERVGGTVDALFGNAGTSDEDEAAANALAGAFNPTPAAQPAVRPATGELSLDHVFRETPRQSGAHRRESSAFSFDQFFSEGAEAAPAAPTPPAAQPGAGAPGDNDEQFNAWLEGLKQK